MESTLTMDNSPLFSPLFLLPALNMAICPEVDQATYNHEDESHTLTVEEQKTKCLLSFRWNHYTAGLLALSSFGLKREKSPYVLKLLLVEEKRHSCPPWKNLQCNQGGNVKKLKNDNIFKSKYTYVNLSIC